MNRYLELERRVASDYHERMSEILSTAAAPLGVPLDSRSVLRAADLADTAVVVRVEQRTGLDAVLRDLLAGAPAPFALTLAVEPHADGAQLGGEFAKAHPVVRVVTVAPGLTESEVLRAVARGRNRHTLLGRGTTAESATSAAQEGAERHDGPSAIAFLLGGIPSEGGGGVHSIWQEARALCELGTRTEILVPTGALPTAHRLYPGGSDVFTAFNGGWELSQRIRGIDALVVAEWSMTTQVRQLGSDAPPLVAGYVQDYEPLFFPVGSSQADQALLSFSAIEGQTLFAKTGWLCDVVERAHALPVAKVRPSLDRQLFRHSGATAPSGGPLRIAAMVRPRTPRRRPFGTATMLARVQSEFGPAVDAVSFGCTAAEFSGLAGPAVPAGSHRGPLSRSGVAELLRETDLFLDLSVYQAFGRTGLEAMACGCVPLLPKEGGVSEYASDGENAIVVDTEDDDAVLAQIATAVEHREHVASLRDAGLLTASRYSISDGAKSIYAVLNGASAVAGSPSRA